jgi:hypothetical protein
MMAPKPKLIDIGENPKSKQTEINTEVEVDLRKKSITHEYSLEQRKGEILDKISNLERKINNLNMKEEMLNNIINGTHIELQNLKENEFTRRGQKQAVLIKQLEALSILHDTVYKWETMIQNYHKILIDIENHKINSLIKVENLKREEKETDENLTEVLETLNTHLKPQDEAPKNSLIDQIQQELEKENY